MRESIIAEMNRRIAEFERAEGEKLRLYSAARRLLEGFVYREGPHSVAECNQIVSEMALEMSERLWAAIKDEPGHD
jgi:hypothetical protein